jgi:hypothetical protein
MQFQFFTNLVMIVKGPLIIRIPIFEIVIMKADSLLLHWCLASWLCALGLSHGEPRQSEEDSDPTLEGSGFNQSTTTTPEMSSPILSPSAIANIISAVLAVTFLTIVLCYLMRSFNQNERTTRIRTTLDNNKRIDEQIAAAKARAEQQTTEQQTNLGLIHGSRETCTASMEVVTTNVDPRPPDLGLQPLITEALDNSPNSNSPQVSGVSREIVSSSPALAPS